MRGMCGKDRGTTVRCRVPAHCIVVSVHWVETRVAVPGFIKVYPVAVFLNQVLRAHGIVTESVVRTIGEHRINRFLVGYLLREGACLCLAANGLMLDLGRRKRADDAVAVARWHHVDRPRAGQHKALFDRLVAVAVEHHKVALLHAGLHNAAVGSRRTDDARVTMVRAKYSCRILLTFRDWAGMVEQRAKRAALDTHIDRKSTRLNTSHLGISYAVYYLKNK